METKPDKYIERKKMSKNKIINVVTCFIVNKDAKVLIETRSDECNLDNGKIDLCSGHIESGEEPKDAMLRELKEELSIENVSKNLQKVYAKYIDIGKRHYYITFFYLKLEKKINIVINKDEVNRIDWIDMEECFSQMRNGNIRIPKSSEYEELFEEVRKANKYSQNN